MERRLKGLGAVLLAALFAALLFLPFPRTVSSPRERYRILWASGKVTEESYQSAFASLEGLAEDGGVALRRGETGYMVPSEALKAAEEVLFSDDIAAMLRFGFGSLSPLERAALLRGVGTVGWYAGESFAFTGNAVQRCERVHFSAVRLLAGSLPSGFLAEAGAASLYLAGEAEFSAKDLIGSAVEKIEASAPYVSKGGALYRGGRLIAAAPTLTALEIAACDSVSEGALCDMGALESLTVPFVGLTEEGGELALLFLYDGNDRVPETLKRVRVTGGTLTAGAFFGTSLREIDACGVDPARIHPDAFAGTAPDLLHTPHADVRLSGSYSTETAPCGCTVYRRQS